MTITGDYFRNVYILALYSNAISQRILKTNITYHMIYHHLQIKLT